MYAHRSHLIARLLMVGSALLLIAAAGALYWHFHRDSEDAHLEAITDMLIAREVGELVYVLSREHCAKYPGACEQADALGPLTVRADVKRVFAPLYAQHMPTATARRVAAAFAGTVGRQANRSQREQALKQRSYWQSLTPAQRDAVDALLASPEGVAYTNARRLVGQQLFIVYNDLIIAEQTQMLSVPLASMAAYARQYQDYVGETAPPPLVLAPIANRYFERRSRIMADSVSKLTVAFWKFKRAGGELLGQALSDTVLANAANASRAAAALQQLQPAFERYLREREAVYRARFVALAALERQSTGAGGTPDVDEFETRLAGDLANIEAARGWYRLAGRVYADARDHPYLMNWGVARPARIDRALEQRFAENRALLEEVNERTRITRKKRDALREDLSAGKLADLLGDEAPAAPPK